MAKSYDIGMLIGKIILLILAIRPIGSLGKETTVKTEGQTETVSIATTAMVGMTSYQDLFTPQMSTSVHKEESTSTLQPGNVTYTGQTLTETELTITGTEENLTGTEQTLTGTGEKFTVTEQNLAYTEQTLTGTEQNVTDTEQAPPVLEEASHLIPYRIGIYIHLIWLPIVVSVGSVGNVLSLLVMLQPHNRRISCCVYMASLAVSDMMMLYLALHYFLCTGIVRNMYDRECIILATLFQMFSLTGILIVLSMTVDRFIAVRYPFKASTLCTPRRARIIITAIFVFSVAYSVPFITTAGLANPSTCLAVKSKSTFALAYSWLNTVINSLVPFVALLVLNTLIIRTIKSRGKYFSNDKQDKSESKEKAQKDTSNKEAQLTAMLLAVTFVLLTLTLPQYIRYVLAVFVDYTSSAHAYSAFMLFVHITNKLYFTNNGVNFFLYCIGGSKFRDDLRRLCVCCGCHDDAGSGGSRRRASSTIAGSISTSAANPSNRSLRSSTVTLASEVGNCVTVTSE